MAGEEELVTASRPSRSPPKKLYAEGRTKTTLRWRTATKKLPDPARRTPYAGGLVWKLLWDSLYTLSTVNCRLFQFPSAGATNRWMWDASVSAGFGYPSKPESQKHRGIGSNPMPHFLSATSRRYNRARTNRHLPHRQRPKPHLRLTCHVQCQGSLSPRRSPTENTEDERKHRRTPCLVSET